MEIRFLKKREDINTTTQRRFGAPHNQLCNSTHAINIYTTVQGKILIGNYF